MKFYHGTSKENWLKIQEEGVLWGIPHIYNYEPPEEYPSYDYLPSDLYDQIYNKIVDPEMPRYRYTYLSPDIEVSEKYGDILLKVDYDPVGVGNLINGKTIDNYGFNPPLGQHCWQFSVFVPISLNKIEVINQ